MLKSLVVSFALVAAAAACAVTVDELAAIAPGWQGEVIAEVDQSYAGWDVEIGDADNDGKNEILSTGCPDSRLYLYKQDGAAWKTICLAENLAEQKPGMGLAVKVVDLNRDGKNEIILGTGEEAPATAFFYVMQTDGTNLTLRTACRPADCNKSGYTHNLAPYDLNGDGMLEVVSAYCGGGEIVRYDIGKDLKQIAARQLHKLSGSGEESIIADVDNDGNAEYLTCNGFRAGKARVEIFEFDSAGELLIPPRVVIDGYDGKGCFYASLSVGDIDNDGANDLVVGWKQEQKVNRSTLIVYRVAEKAEPVCVVQPETEDLDLGYFEKMMAIADADNDGKNELLVSTRGDNKSEFITSNHLGNIFVYRLKDGKPAREQLVKFKATWAESSWIAVGDADNDGRNEVVAATGFGDRTQPGWSYILLLKRK